ncbi:MAG: hypothetical protein C0454_10745 [Parvibaculum sp.]|jgi:hypothetical protein|nr:hypothetical protein [Parvibaculum sp.]
MKEEVYEDDSTDAVRHLSQKTIDTSPCPDAGHRYGRSANLIGQETAQRQLDARAALVERAGRKAMETSPVFHQGECEQHIQ